ncbi:MAG TPA: SPFH domain-containing protein [Bryobacteraceae bacterium]|jgi:membrane protease subunit (stomatin/prohibitin family)|nr:SPFH domain-containing protein [Bryobacteraceae bacterium]
MGLHTLVKPFLDVIRWTDADPGSLAYRYPMDDLEIHSGTQLTVGKSQIAAFVSEGRIADVFDPGLYTLNARTLPLLIRTRSAEQDFSLKSDVYFFSTRIQIDQRWGTATPVTIYDKELGPVRVRVYGVYSYRITDPRVFFNKVSGTRAVCSGEDVEGQLRNILGGRLSEALSPTETAFPDLAANLAELARRVAERSRPAFAALGIALDSLVIESLSVPDDLEKLYQPLAACAACAKAIPRSAKFCPECGKPRY